MTLFRMRRRGSWVAPRPALVHGDAQRVVGLGPTGEPLPGASFPALTGASRRFVRGAAALHHDEGGASLVFAAITLFSLALASFMVFQVGMVSSERLQIQGAADAAAYSAAVVEANSLDSIGQLNDSMSYVHYTLLRYTVDQIVYGTLAQFRTHHTAARRENGSLFSQPTPLAVPPMGQAAPGDPSESGGSIENQPGPTFVPLGDANDWNERISRVKRLGGLDGQETDGLRRSGESMIQQAAKWELDLHTAARIIMNTTPRLCREVALEVADKNGATRIAFSSDLEKAFTTSGDGAGFGQNDGGTDPVEGTASEQLYLRYQKLRTLAVDAGQRYDYPSWFEEAKGKSGNGYSTVRLCWNVNDWAHGQGRFEHEDFPQYSSGAPSGHWSAAHTHYWLPSPDFILTPQQPHGGISPRGQERPTAGGKGGSHGPPMDDDPDVHMKALETQGLDPFANDMAHHAYIVCPTCAARKYDPQSRWTEVKKVQQDVTTYADPSNLELKFQGGFPKPLVLRDAALRSGITVAAWRESTGIGEILPGNEWGLVAVASAQVGLLDREGKVQSLSQLTADRATYTGSLELQLKNDDKFRNLCYSIDPEKGVRFGARLVPIARDLTHHPNLASGGAVDELIGSSGTRWWVTSTSDTPTGSAAPGPMAKLKEWVKVDSPQALKEALWH